MSGSAPLETGFCLFQCRSDRKGQRAPPARGARSASRPEAARPVWFPGGDALLSSRTPARFDVVVADVEMSPVSGLAVQSGGDIWVTSDPGEATVFQIYLPAVSEAAERAAPLAREVSPGGSETILLVEDDEAVRRLAARLLESAGYRVLPAANAAEAAEIAGREGRDVRLLVSDVILPGASGPQLAESLRVAYPSLKVLFMSGYTDTAIVHRDVFAPGTAFLQKPFTPAGLMRKVREVLDPVSPPEA